MMTCSLNVAPSAIQISAIALGLVQTLHLDQLQQHRVRHQNTSN